MVIFVIKGENFFENKFKIELSDILRLIFNDIVRLFGFSNIGFLKFWII